MIEWHPATYKAASRKRKQASVAAEARLRALEEAAKICDAHAKSAARSKVGGPEHQCIWAEWAYAAGLCAKNIRAVAQAALRKREGGT